MRANWWWYLIVIAIAVASVWAALSAPLDDWLKQMLALPAIGSLFAALFQVLRDSNAAAHERAKQDRDHAFTVAATSHMSQTLFNKQIEFAEQYVERVQELLGKIFAEGPSMNILTWMEPLHESRRKYRLWLTSEMTAGLDQLQVDLRQMAVHMGRFSAKDAPQKDRDDGWNKAHNLFFEVLDLPGSTSEKQAASYNVAIQHLQKVLGIAELTRRRDQLFSTTGSIPQT